MSTYQDLLAVVQDVRDRTGDPNAWQTGLTPTEVRAVISPTTPPQQLDLILAKIRQQLSAPAPVPAPSAPPVPSDRQQGEAAAAIAEAEAALAHQNSASSQLDLQVISAILNAHLMAVEGREALSKLQQETEAAVRTRSDLDTPAGARDFQRFLIGKLRDIRAVVANASLDDTSKSALMAAWTSLYDASKHGDPGEPPPAAAAPEPVRGSGKQVTALPDDESDPLLDSLLLNDPGLLDDPGLLAGDPPNQGAPGPAVPAAPMPPVLPSIPNLGGSLMPGAGMPGSGSGWAAPGGLPLSGLLDRNRLDPAARDLDDPHLPSEDPDSKDHPASEETDEHKDDQVKEAVSQQADPPTAGPTTVTLPDGETVTAATPQLAAAIKAAAGGVPIADAFRQQGITIPPPGTAVANPIDPSRVIPGDIGIFTDRHALALGPGKALLDGQIHNLSAVSGPGFLGWEHPPTPTPATATAPAKAETPTPTRPAGTPAATQ
jgi:Domain of unknown function (DUF4226)